MRKEGFAPTPSDKKHGKITLLLNHGDVVVMAGALQDFWYHEVPKEDEQATVHRWQLLPGKKRLKKVQPTTVRFNLTFRPYRA